MSKPEYPTLSIVWMERGDLVKIVKIENDTHENKDTRWSEKDFLRELKEKNQVGMVVKDKDKIVGYVIYVLHLKKIHILHLGATQDQYQQVVMAILDKVKSKLNIGRRVGISITVRETDLPLQKLLKAEAFKAYEVQRGFFIDTDEDAFLFKYELPHESSLLTAGTPHEMLD